MQNIRFSRNYEFLQKKFNRITISKIEFSLLHTISPQTLDARMSKGINLPFFLKLGASSNSTIRFTIVDVACYMSDIELDVHTKNQLLYEYLFKKYKRIIITRKLFCNELNISLGTLNLKMKNNKAYIPIFIKAEKRNSPIFFNIYDLSDYLARSTKTM